MKIKFYIIINSIVILNIVGLYLINSINNNNKKINKLNIYSKNKFKITEIIDEKCELKCYEIYYIVNRLYQLIKQYGFKKTLDYVKSNKNTFITFNKSTLYIFGYDKVNNSYNNYYYKIEKKYNKNLLKKLKSIGDKYNSGYFDYEFIDNDNKKYIRKIYVKKIKYDENDSIYITSSYIRNIKKNNIDITGIIIKLLGLLLFNIIWFNYDFSKFISNLYINIIYIFSNILFLLNIYFLRSEPDEFSKEKANLETNNTNSLGMATLNLGLLVFAGDIKKYIKKDAFNAFFKLLFVSAISFLLSVVTTNTENLAIILKRKSDIKMILMFNGIIYLIISLVILFMNRKK